jgi:hypothetical protein
VSVREWQIGVIACFTQVVVACSGSSGEPTTFQETMRTHAVLWVDQRLTNPEPVESTETVETSVTFGALRVPPTVNSNRLLELMGLGLELPPVGTCELSDTRSHVVPALSSFERAELLDIGDVGLRVPSGPVKLTRQAFPTVTDFISGVLYTTRDRLPDTLANRELRLYSTGSSGVMAFDVAVEGSPFPRGVTVDATPLGEVARLSTMASLELRWSPGRTGDRIWVEIAANYGKKTWSCAFEDDTGRGVLTGVQSNEYGEGRLIIHRITSKPIPISPLDRAEVRMDMRITQPVVLY